MKQFTIRFTTENISDCQWIFDQIKSGKISNGISIGAIGDGVFIYLMEPFIVSHIPDMYIHNILNGCGFLIVIINP